MGKDWLKPSEVLKYDEELGKIAVQNLASDYIDKDTNGIGSNIEEVRE